MGKKYTADIFADTESTGALIAQPAYDVAIRKCNRNLRCIGLKPMPKGYADFLKAANGYAWNGFEFYGTDICKEASSGYVLRDIVAVNYDMRERKCDFPANTLILGQFDEDIYIYDDKKKKYLSLDSMTLSEMDAFDSFSDLLESTVGLYAELDEDATHTGGGGEEGTAVQDAEESEEDDEDSRAFAEFLRLCEASPYFFVKPGPYDEVRPFREGMAAVSIDGKWGYVDKTGEQVLPAVCEMAGSFFGGLAGVRVEGKACLVDPLGNIKLETDYNWIGLSSRNPGIAMVQKGWLWGCIDLEGRVLAPPKYVQIRSFSEGRAAVLTYGEDEGLRINKYGFIDTSGKEIVPPIYQDVGYFEDGFAEVCLDGKWGLIDRRGRVTVPIEYEEIDYSSGRVAFSLDGLWGLMDTKGHVLFHPRYDRVYARERDEIAVAKDGLRGLVTADGAELLPLRYDKLHEFSGEKHLAGAGFGGKYGFIDAAGHIVIPFQYDNVDMFYDGYAAVTIGSRTGTIDENGQIVIPLEYDAILDICGDMAIAYKNNMLYLFDGSELAIAPLPYYMRGNVPLYHTLQDEAIFINGLAWIRVCGLWGAVGKP